jgi:hypothetical protein
MGFDFLGKSCVCQKIKTMGQKNDFPKKRIYEFEWEIWKLKSVKPFH